MTPDDQSEIIKLRLTQAKECLEDAEFLLKHNKGFRTVVNRSYYATFYAVLAALQTQEFIPKKHIGAIRLFDQHFIKTGALPKSASQTLHWLFEIRMQDDYKVMAEIEENEAVEALNSAKQFVAEINQYLSNQL
jgi:uncharacterized protein (UPF0332 family)